MKKTLFILLVSCFLSSISCEPMTPFRSLKTDTRYVTIEFGDFSVTAWVGYTGDDCVGIALGISAPDSLTVWADSLRVLYSQTELSYEIRDKGRRLKNTYRFFKEEGSVVYLTKRKVDTLSYGDQIVLYGPQMFQVGERMYDLDTLRFVLRK